MIKLRVVLVVGMVAGEIAKLAADRISLPVAAAPR